MSSKNKEAETIQAQIIDQVDSADLDIDYQFARQTYYDLLQMGMDALPNLREVAEESEHPRAYEVLINGIKHMADLTDKFLEHQRRHQVIAQDSPKGVEYEEEDKKQLGFVGSVKELQDALKNKE